MKGFGSIENLFDRPTYKFENEIVNTLLNSTNIRIEKIISDGHTTCLLYTSLWFTEI